MRAIAQKVFLFAKQNRFTAPIYEPMKNRFIAIRNSGRSRMNVLRAFPLFSPYSGGSYQMRAPLAIAAVNDIIPSLWAFSQKLGREPLVVMTTVEYSVAFGPGEPEDLRALFDRYGSDKATSHDYYKVYASILGQLGRTNPLQMLEIGLGTNNIDVASHMGVAGCPGASLRAFRDFLPQAKIVGADIDTRILFEEDRIRTFFIDQTDRKTFEDLAPKLPGHFDLMIDDGLHLPTANINSLSFFLGKLSHGGYAVIEDIPLHAENLWQMVAGLLPDHYQSQIVRSGPTLMFVTRRQV